MTISTSCYINYRIVSAPQWEDHKIGKILRLMMLHIWERVMSKLMQQWWHRIKAVVQARMTF